MSATERAAESFDELRHQLREALAHLHDPDYQPPELLRQVVGHPQAQDKAAFQAAILQKIADLAPHADAPATSRAQRDYEVLRHRFVLGLTQEEAAEHLHMSVRTLGRAQRQATHALARMLWEQRQRADAGTAFSEHEGSSSQSSDDWRSQVRENLAALRASAPELVSNVYDVIASALERVSTVVLQSERPRAAGVPRDLVAKVHPSVLRQVLIMAMTQLLATGLGGVELSAHAEEDRVVIRITGPASDLPEDPEVALLREILACDGGDLEIRAEGGRLEARIAIPAAGKVTVLVVDDNIDALHYYRRCVEQTRFHLIHARSGDAALEQMRSRTPDVIVLDIVLPDMDGWDFMQKLRRNPVTRSIPVIICSIVKEERLASALGAIQCLPKPVRDAEFLHALEQAIAQAPTASPRTGAHSTAAF